jgi:two-component sensor histidine kinase
VAKVLTFSRRGTTITETLDLRPLAEEVYKLLRASCPPDVRVKLSLAEAPVLVRANASEIHQVLLNLGTNAAHAMRASGGTLEISVGWSDPPPGGGPSRARLSVRDEGCGIPESVRHRIFDPYFTTKRAEEGTGLGLAVVHGIVTAAGGTVEVDSVAGRGTRFDVLLPVAPATQVPTPERVAEAAIGGGGERLALIDDDPLVAVALSEALRDLGYDLELFVDSRAARRALTAAPGAYDLVICDEGMPRVSGSELLRAVRECVPAQRVLLLSSRSPAAGGYDPSLPSVAKPLPLPLPLLAREIRRLLDDEPPPGEAAQPVSAGPRPAGTR